MACNNTSVVTPGDPEAPGGGVGEAEEVGAEGDALFGFWLEGVVLPGIALPGMAGGWSEKNCNDKGLR